MAEATALYVIPSHPRQVELISNAKRAVLIHSGELDPAVEASDYIDFIIAADEMVKG